MATKNNPGKFDCYGNAAPDEPMFILLGRDPAASLLINLWATLRGKLASREQLDEARACARACEEWARKLGKDEKIAAVEDAWRSVKLSEPAPL